MVPTADGDERQRRRMFLEAVNAGFGEVLPHLAADEVAHEQHLLDRTLADGLEDEEWSDVDQES